MSEKPSLRQVPLRRLYALARPEAASLLAGALFLVIGSAAALLFPRAIGLLVDAALGGKGTEAIDRMALWMGGVFLAQAAATGLRYYFFHLAGERIIVRVREQLYRSLMDQEVGFFDQTSTGELGSRLISDTASLQSVLSSNISILLRNVVSVVGGAAFLIYTSPPLALLMLSVVPPLALGAIAFGRRLRRLSRQVQDVQAEAHQVADESLSGIRTVRAFAADDHEVRRFSAALGRAFQLARRRVIGSSLFNGTASLAAYTGVGLVFWYGGRLVGSGELSVGGLTSFLVYTLLVAVALGALGDLWAELMGAIGAADRVFELIDRVPALPPRGGRIPERMEGRVEFKDVHFRYPARQEVAVLRGLDLKTAAGEVVALVGPSGAGKSTIASLLYRLYDPTEGRILLDGADLRELEPNWLRGRIGVVAQEPVLFSCSIAENIRYGRPDATDAEVETAARAANAHDFISRFPEGYRTEVGEQGVQLSGGQKQRVAIARAVLKDPRLLILDEATSALDAESEHLVKDALDRLMKGRTTFIIAHRLSTVANADRVLVLEDGHVIQSGTHAALLGQEGLYRRLVERQFVAA
ncbi:ABC transporter ATP-binding protein [Hyalangium rubrum]|uniref:ABC transporter transmembrane domain-containing protein n=1 Tax=Hyalangium rubrum TaxID=3103134 RepID=A0ABU5H5N9_9BACT|nr:ABC transporter transmembrane domain-containing protein [Hyalangium sp. s54d21]MDY7228803.1 ABC transporter transmembrane domain-containing protein [Hyalangium sp. s54d21]